jgi:hypothetical protein
MVRSRILVTVAVCSAILVGLFANSPSAEAGNCEAKLVNHSYNCVFQDNDFAPFTECWDIGTGGVSQYFDMYNGVEYGCGCDATGSANSPKFNNSANTFECSDSEAPFTFIGKIDGKKLVVQGVGSTGEQYVGTCTLRTSVCP